MLSSIHANDAIGVVYRLLDLGIEPFLVSSALIGVVAQRMVRSICPNCARSVDAPPLEQAIYAKEVGKEKSQFLYGAGCKSCANTGYRGRTGIFEILQLSDEMRMQLLKGATAAQLTAQALEEGMITLLRDGMFKVEKEMTTPAEVLRNAYAVE